MRVLVIHAGALHLGYVGCYGSDWVATPNLDSLAATGVAFDRHFASNPALNDTCLTGRLQFPSAAGQVPGDVAPNLPEILQSHGVRSLIVEPEVSSKDRARELKRWARGSNPFCWINWPAFAPPWDVPEEFLEPYFPPEEEEPLSPWLDPPTGPFDEEGCDRERLQNTYAAVMTHFDAELGTLLGEISENDDLLICITASSGLALGEHGYIGAHRAWLHEEVVHVPLILRLPGSTAAGLRVAGLTQPADLLPTILTALELPPVESHGFDLLPLIREEVEHVRPRACSGLAVGDSVEWSLRTPEWAFLLPLATPPNDPPRAPQLFVKPDDRWELNDVRQHHLELAEEFEQNLRATISGRG